jgi:hypothetical protein
MALQGRDTPIGPAQVHGMQADIDIGQRRLNSFRSYRTEGTPRYPTPG